VIALTAAASARAKDAKKVPTTPLRSASGANTTTVVSVDEITGPASSDTPAAAASAGARPATCSRWMASTTTTASSMTSPTAMAMPPSDMRLSEP
jgi:hypothetical protein